MAERSAPSQLPCAEIELSPTLRSKASWVLSNLRWLKADVAGIAMRRLRTKTARAALARAERDARHAGISALKQSRTLLRSVIVFPQSSNERMLRSWRLKISAPFREAGIRKRGRPCNPSHTDHGNAPRLART